MRSDPYQGCNFTIEIEGLLVGGFSECSGLEVETELVEYHEGGVNDYVHRFAGRTRSAPLVLRRGITVADGLWRWYQMTAAGQVVRRNGTIFLLEGAYGAGLHWNFKEAFPYKWTGPDLRADASSVAFESIELSHRGLALAGKRPQL
jgi:phage tail-like protein